MILNVGVVKADVNDRNPNAVDNAHHKSMKKVFTGGIPGNNECADKEDRDPKYPFN
jgi:hypothetical protein